MIWSDLGSDLGSKQALQITTVQNGRFYSKSLQITTLLTTYFFSVCVCVLYDCVVRCCCVCVCFSVMVARHVRVRAKL